MTVEFLLSVVSLLLVAIGSIAWWGFRAVVHNQGEMEHKLDTMTITLTGVHGKLEKLEQWQDLHQEEDERRFGQLERLLTKGDCA